MIVLIDNENYMIRLCKDTPDIHGFNPNYPNWRNYVKFLSDAGELVVLSGKTQEKWLDENNIYYIHVEAKPKESFETFKRRMYRQIEENKEYLNTSTSFGKLVFALTKGPMETGNVTTDNIVEIWRSNSDEKFSLRLDLPDNVSDHTYYLLVKCIKGIFKKFLGDSAAEGITVSELTSPEFNLFTSDTLSGMLPRLQLLEDLFKNGYVVVDVADEEYPDYDYYEDEDDVPSDCANCQDYGCPDNPHYDENYYSDDEEESENENDENCEVHSFEETEDEKGNPVYKVNGEEVSKEQFEDAMKDGILSMFAALAKAFGKGE